MPLTPAQGGIGPNIMQPGKGQQAYCEFLTNSGTVPHTFSFSEESAETSFQIEIPWQDFIAVGAGSGNNIIPNILGWAEKGSKHGATMLHRQLPWMNPYFYWQWASGISNIKPCKFIGKGTNDASMGSPISKFDRVMATVTFTTPTYNVFDDDVIHNFYDDDESNRYVTKLWKPTAEFISVKTGQFYFAEGPAGNPRDRQFNLGSNYLMTKVDLEWIWHGVPDNYLFNASGIPTGLLNGLGRVNLLEFAGYPEGTLLALPMELTPITMPIDPQVVIPGGDFRPGMVARAWDVKFLFKEFDPPLGTDATTRGWNTAFYVKDASFYKIRSVKPDATGNRNLYRPYDFRKFFQAAT